MLDERASAGRENLDADHVARYDAKEDAGASAELLLCRSSGSARSDRGRPRRRNGQFAIAAASDLRACGRR